MAKQILIEIKDVKANKLLKNLEELNIIKIINDPLIGLSGEKRLQAKNFLAAYKQAKDAAKGKVKLKTLDQVINEL